jgi:hypothetical protein
MEKKNRKQEYTELLRKYEKELAIKLRSNAKKESGKPDTTKV